MLAAGVGKCRTFAEFKHERLDDRDVALKGCLASLHSNPSRLAH